MGCLSLSRNQRERIVGSESRRHRGSTSLSLGYHTTCFTYREEEYDFGTWRETVKMVGFTIDWFNPNINKHVAFLLRRARWTSHWGWNSNISKLSRRKYGKASFIRWTHYRSWNRPFLHFPRGYQISINK